MRSTLIMRFFQPVPSLRATPWLFFLLALPTLVFAAGKIEITGHGEASAPPDKVFLDIRVSSICYDSTREAKAANAEVANQIVDLSKKYLRQAEDKVVTFPGSFLISTEYVPTTETHSRILCERKWRTWNTVRLTLHEISTLPEVQDELLNLVSSSASIHADKTQQTYSEISSPQFALTLESQNRLRKEAQEAALKDAQDQFKNFDATCHFKSAKLNSVAQPQFSNTVRYSSKASESPEASTPIIPQSITVNAVWNFIWEFESASGCYN